ncbi:MAG TPA: YXWGXW repeat-containing protein [Candidatus Solibacter sp.]|nr:YXWGXW repeat-containing protein [Candidatus Solibacter sp.]
MQRLSARAALIGFVMLIFIVPILSSTSFGQLRISVSFGPPPIPVYEQPLCPGDGYIWTPGYWAWSDDDGDYYWVPGTWVLAPEVGVFWTPPYWAWLDGAFVFYDGYWGPHVGFYGGIDYGFGYFGDGFVGGRWDGGHFFYNRSVTNVNVTVIHNVYNTTIVHNDVSRVSYNGGNGGVVAHASAEQESWARERHIPPAVAQVQHVQEARGDRELRASANHGKPPVAATARPGEFRGEAVPAREAGGAYNPPANRGGGQPRAEEGNRPSTPIHAKDLPPMERSAAPNTGDAKLDKKYQQQQDKLQKKQDQERAKLQQQQEKEDQRMSQQEADDARKQQTEQRHQQQTQQLQQRHTQQREQMQQRQAPPSRPAGRPEGGKPPRG